MLCEFCHGKGLVRGDGGLGPCAECGGFGVLHCCEGLQARPEGPPTRLPTTSHCRDERPAAQPVLPPIPCRRGG
jgi:hypothetical protein